MYMPENNLPQQQPQYIYVQQPRYNDDDEVEIDLIELFKAIWKKKWLIFVFMVLGTGLGLAYALYLPFIYKAEAKIMPQSGAEGGRMRSLAAQYGGIASMMGISMPEGLGGMGAVFIDILNSNFLVDRIIDRFNLMEEYNQKYRLSARKAVLKNFEAEIDTKGSGVITVSYKHNDPNRAAEILNAFIEELQKKTQDMSFSYEKQKRVFYESHLAESQRELVEAEEALMKYQQTTGAIALDKQTSKLIDAMSDLRAQIAAKNSEIATLKSYLTSNNPRVKFAQSQLESIQRELKKLEEEQKWTADRTLANEGMLLAGEIPEAGLESQRLARNVNVARGKYEFMRGQYESARLGESSEFSTVAVIDPPLPPDYKDGPSRAKITLIGSFLGFFLPVGWISGKFVIKESQKKKKKNEDEDNEY